jgi:hypothetical protein
MHEMTKNDVLVLYDITGIQDFIFSSSKLKDNIGASRIVSNVLGRDAIREVIKSSGGKVILSGGGNTLVRFPSRTLATKMLSKRAVERTGGSLRFAVAYQEFGGSSFNDVFCLLGNAISKKKREMDKTGPMLGIGITKLESGTNRPVIGKLAHGTYVSRETAIKRSAAEERDVDHLPQIIQDISFIKDKTVAFETNLDLYYQKKGEEGYIAVCHVDGDDIGDLAIKATKDATTLDEAINFAMSFSTSLDNAFNRALVSVITTIYNALEMPEIQDVLDIGNVDKKVKKRTIPFYPVVYGGDDITFITNGLLGISAAALFLKTLSTNKVSVAGREENISASAGVAIVKTKFPFNKAYHVAEWLCTNAKNVGKISKELGRKPASRGSWLDFQVITSTTAWDAEISRRSMYSVPGMVVPPALESRNRGLRSPRYNLLRRPYCIMGGEDDGSAWKDVVRAACGFRSTSWPRSKLMDLRKAFFSSKESVQGILEDFKVKGLTLPPCGGSVLPETGFDETLRITPYLDAIELATYFNDLSFGGSRE